MTQTSVPPPLSLSLALALHLSLSEPSETFKPSFMQIIRFNDYGVQSGGVDGKKRGPKANRRCQSHESQVYIHTYLPSFFLPQQLARSSHAR